jgi:hypothetical protein
MKLSRRSFLGAAYGAAATSNFRLHVEMGGYTTSSGEVLNPGFLTAALTWKYPTKPGESQYDEMLLPYAGVILRVSLQENLQDPFINLRLPEDKTSYRLAVIPDTTYYWAVVPFDEHGEHPEASSTHHFRTEKPEIEDVDDDRIRYKNPREGAHWQARKSRGVVEFAECEPLSPWYSRKSYLGGPPPTFEKVKGRLPVPILDTAKPLVDLYWYCWQTLLRVWSFAPTAADHQAVANILGYRAWGSWGSTMVFDSAFMLHFARYGHRAYPFIDWMDNCYARQHENGFVCRESDSNNREVYATFPLNPPLFAWVEWEYYSLSNDAERLQRVLLPIVKHYEWWMRYQRRRNGLYWIDGLNEADDSPRNDLMYYAVSANSYQALAAVHAARIARRVGRNDLAVYFEGEHTALGRLVNERFWDAVHSLYNDLTKDGRFITELEPGVYCKHCHMFWPLIAEIASEKGIEGMTRELMNPKSFYRYSGVPSLSADSKGYRQNGQYWRGSVWPPVQCIVQEGLRVSGRWKLASDLAHKYLNAILEAYEREHTITENLAPDSPIGHGAKEFVGWGGIGPVSDLIEYVLGFNVNAPDNIIEWRINRQDRHGIENLAMGGVSLTLLCDARQSAKEPCHLTCESTGDLTLKVFVQDRRSVHHLSKGRTDLVLS